LNHAKVARETIHRGGRAPQKPTAFVTSGLRSVQRLEHVCPAKVGRTRTRLGPMSVPFVPITIRLCWTKWECTMTATASLASWVPMGGLARSALREHTRITGGHLHARSAPQIRSPRQDLTPLNFVSARRGTRPTKRKAVFVRCAKLATTRIGQGWRSALCVQPTLSAGLGAKL